jgi:hypothetical protein
MIPTTEAATMATNARDDYGNLRCQVPGCRAVIHALTGFQELEKLRAHLFRVHLAYKNIGEVLETRAEWERRDDGVPR